MASAQYERKEEEAVGLIHETKETLDGLIKQAESVDHGEHEHDHDHDHDHDHGKFLALGAGGPKPKKKGTKLQTTVVAGAMKNLAKGSLTKLATKKWAGHIVKDYPNTLNGTGFFTLSALTTKGVKAAVVYSGKNNAGVETAWLLAFADTADLKRRIYAEGGPKSNFININWDEVEQNLNKAGTTANAPGVHATIAGTSGKSAVGAIFSG